MKNEVVRVPREEGLWAGGLYPCGAQGLSGPEGAPGEGSSRSRGPAAGAEGRGRREVTGTRPRLVEFRDKSS